MESAVVVDKPPEYHGKGNNDRGFPFDDEEGSGAWSELASRHPDIAARLRQRPSTWARKRRPTSQDGDDFGDNGFSGFDRFPFDDIPPEFRGHFPSHWNRRFSSREEQPPSSPPAQSHSPQPQQTSAATQTELHPDISQPEIHTSLPQYGLRNTVDLGQKSPADPSLVDAQERSPRSMSAPPDNRSANQSHTPNMSAPNHKEGHPPQQEPSNVRHIPIFVEGRDEPVINRTVDHGTHFGETKPAYTPPPQQPHVDRDQYFADDVPAGFHHAPNFPRTFGTPFNKSYRQNTQPFVQQKVYPQNAFARGTSPQRSQSPKPQMHPEEHYVKVPVHHEQAAPPTRPQQKQPPQQHQKPAPQPQPQKPAPHQPHQPPPQQQEAPPQPKPQQPNANDPITQILSIQTDVLNLMTDVENFTGSKKDKRYMYLDEMLTRNLIKLDTIETEGKENIRQARKEAIRCIQKCIAVLEAKAEKGNSTPQPQDVEMESAKSAEPQVEQTEGSENGEVEMKEAKENGEVEMKDIAKDTVAETNSEESAVPPQENAEQKTVEETKMLAETQATDIRPEENKPEATSNQDENEKPVLSTETNADKKPSPKKATKVAKKRDKSKDKKEGKEASNKEEKVECKDDKEQAMEVDGNAASQ